MDKNEYVSMTTMAKEGERCWELDEGKNNKGGKEKEEVEMMQLCVN